MLSRRGLLVALAGAALDPERLFWRPGAKLISIPKPPRQLFAKLTMDLASEPDVGVVSFGKKLYDERGNWCGLWVVETVTREEYARRYPPPVARLAD